MVSYNEQTVIYIQLIDMKHMVPISYDKTAIYDMKFPTNGFYCSHGTPTLYWYTWLNHCGISHQHNHINVLKKSVCNIWSLMNYTAWWLNSRYAHDSDVLVLLFTLWFLTDLCDLFKVYGTVAIMWSLECQWRNPERRGSTTCTEQK